jgi:hypothetical protein
LFDSHVGKIEIANKNVRVILRKSLDEIKDQKHWSKFIPLVMLKMNNVPAGNTAPPFLLKRNHLAKQDFNHTNISKTDEKMFMNSLQIRMNLSEAQSFQKSLTKELTNVIP